MKRMRMIAACALACLLCTALFPAYLAYGEETGEYLGTWTVANCESYVSLRAWPDRKADRVVKVPKWADVEAYYYNSEWFECFYGGMHGYILSQYLTDRPGKYSDYPGNQSRSDSRFDLDNFGYRSVKTGGRGALVFQKSPRGAFLYDYEYWDGDRIYVNLNWRQDGYAIAYENGVYGYVDASYIAWNGGSSSGGSGERDLSNFEYRRVNTGGRGNLVFQKSPGGAFLKSHSFTDGDRIYVNVDWRKSGYAIAYEDGVYGYVDASYIDW